MRGWLCEEEGVALVVDEREEDLGIPVEPEKLERVATILLRLDRDDRQERAQLERVPRLAANRDQVWQRQDGAVIVRLWLCSCNVALRIDSELASALESRDLVPEHLESRLVPRYHAPLVVTRLAHRGRPARLRSSIAEVEAPMDRDDPSATTRSLSRINAVVGDVGLVLLVEDDAHVRTHATRLRGSSEAARDNALARRDQSRERTCAGI